MAFEEPLPPFDPKSTCAKCGYSIPDPEAPTKQGPDGGMMVTGPAPNPTQPTVAYCNGLTCPWTENNGDVVPEHMHQFCTTCGYEWATAPLS